MNKSGINKKNIIRDDVITPAEIEALRTAVGWNPNKDKYEFALKETYTQFSIKENKQVIAFARVISDTILYSFIVDLLIHPEFQKKGIGKLFVTHIIDELKKDGIKFIQLTFNKDLEPFYKSCGFEIIEAGSIINE